MERERKGMDDKWRGTRMSPASASGFPGFRFSPTDQELICYYLKNKLLGFHERVQVIPEVEICKYEPWDLPAKSLIQSENEWFFFSHCGRKYPNGSQSKRATVAGYWKATGKERNVKSGSDLIGTKRTLVFHIGRAPKRERTEWLMHEFHITGQSQDSLVVCRLRKNSEPGLNYMPREGSSSQNLLTPENNNNFSLSEACAEQSSLFKGANLVECCSKDCSNSNNSHSDEQPIDAGSESDQTPKDEFSQPGFTHQDCDDDECYAEILKDDIVDLGKSLLPRTPDLLPVVADKSEDERGSQQREQTMPPDVLPFQGTAMRRIRLRRLKPETYLADSLEGEESITPNSEQLPKYMKNSGPERKLNHLSMFTLLIVLILLVLLGGAWLLKRFPRAWSL